MRTFNVTTAMTRMSSYLMRNESVCWSILSNTSHTGYFDGRLLSSVRVQPDDDEDEEDQYECECENENEDEDGEESGELVDEGRLRMVNSAQSHSAKFIPHRKPPQNKIFNSLIMHITPLNTGKSQWHKRVIHCLKGEDQIPKDWMGFNQLMISVCWDGMKAEGCGSTHKSPQGLAGLAFTRSSKN